MIELINFLFINKFIIILVSSFGIYLAFWVYYADRKAKTNQLFTLMMLFALSWIILCYFSGILINNLGLSLFLARLAYGIAILFFIPFYFFSLWFIKKKEEVRLLKIFIPIGSLTIFFLSVFTDFMAEKMIPINIIGISMGVAPVIGVGKFIYFGFVFFVAVLVVVRLIKAYFKVSKIEKLKLQYFLIGIIIFVIANLVFNVIFASWVGDARYYQLGNYSAIFLLAFTAYAIVKRELFGIKVIVTSIFVVLIAILLALDMLLFTEVFLIKALKTAALLIFLVFGRILINSVANEVKRREELEKLSRAKSEFISMASHQLRTPLTAIKGYSSLMMEGTYDKSKAKQKKVLKNIFISTERLIKIVNDLLNLSRIELGRLEIEKEPVRIEELAESVFKEMKSRAKEKEIKLLYEKPKQELPELNLDSLKIRQAIFNLVDNAIKYTEDGEIKIIIEKIKDKIRITISDTGRGFSSEEAKRLFELFIRGEAGIDTFVEGTGIGLNVARKFVELHGGNIRAESEGKNKGAKFYIELPIVSKEAEEFIKRI